MQRRGTDTGIGSDGAAGTSCILPATQLSLLTLHSPPLPSSPCQELYGYVNMSTREWKDGLLSCTMRELANVPDDNPKWIILDGDLGGWGGV